jgi:hypothetical protein
LEEESPWYYVLIDKIGAQHKMSTYLHWMETLPEVLNMPTEDITWDDMMSLDTQQ